MVSCYTCNAMIYMFELDNVAKKCGLTQMKNGSNSFEVSFLTSKCRFRVMSMKMTSCLYTFMNVNH